MSSQTVEENQQVAGDFSPMMKRDWDERARENSKWYINTVRLDQSEAEFDVTGWNEITGLILPELDLITEGREPKDLKFLGNRLRDWTDDQASHPYLRRSSFN